MVPSSVSASADDFRSSFRLLVYDVEVLTKRTLGASKCTTHFHLISTMLFDNDDEQDCGGMDLHDLFTNTNYREYVVNITGCVPEPLNVKLLASPSATTDPELTGQLIWPVSTLVSHFIASPMGKKLIKGKNVIELGAGCGLPGIVASQSGASHVTFTDGNEVVVNTLLEQNAKRYAKCPTSVCQFVWGNIDHFNNVRSITRRSFDVVLAADVVQWPAVLEPLIHTIKALLWDDIDKEAEKICIIGIVQRSLKTSSLFFHFAKKLGFDCSKLDMESLFPVDEAGKTHIPFECREHGGLETELFMMKLSDRSVQPLLHSNNAQSVIVGENYENTSYMPC